MIEVSTFGEIHSGRSYVQVGVPMYSLWQVVTYHLAGPISCNAYYWSVHYPIPPAQ